MSEYRFQNPTIIHYGEGKIAEIANCIPKNSKVLVLYGGGSIKKNGVYDQVKEALKGFTWGEFSGIEPNPQYDTLMKALAIVKAEKYDFLLAVGGGSVIDGVKFVAAAAKFEGNDPWDILAKGLPIKDMLPLGSVLTLPATGSEANNRSVVSRGEDKLDFRSGTFFPVFAILDPKTTLSLDRRQTSNGVIDAYSHVLEQYFTYPVKDARVQDYISEALLMVLIEQGIEITKNPSDINVRGNIMIAADLALNDLAGSGVPHDWTSHAIGHAITGVYGIDHARTLSIILPATMKRFRKEKEEKLLQYAKNVFKITSGTKDEIIDQAIAKTIEFFRTMDMPVCFKDVNLSEKDLPALMENLKRNDMFNLGENGTIGLAELNEVLHLALVA